MWHKESVGQVSHEHIEWQGRLEGTNGPFLVGLSHVAECLQCTCRNVYYAFRQCCCGVSRTGETGGIKDRSFEYTKTTDRTLTLLLPIPTLLSLSFHPSPHMCLSFCLPLPLFVCLYASSPSLCLLISLSLPLTACLYLSLSRLASIWPSLSLPTSIWPSPFLQLPSSFSPCLYPPVCSTAISW